MERPLDEGRLLLHVLAGISRARKARPAFACGSPEALGHIHAGYLAFEEAVERGDSPELEQDRAFALAMNALRFCLGDHLQEEQDG